LDTRMRQSFLQHLCNLLGTSSKDIPNSAQSGYDSRLQRFGRC
jgi:hypothetical protein